jgi:hypothetical protein
MTEYHLIKLARLLLVKAERSEKRPAEPLAAAKSSAPAIKA